MKRSERNFLGMYFLTVLGSTVSSIISFIRIHETSGSVGMLSVALSLKTLVIGILVFNSRHLIARVGAVTSVAITQIIGVVAVAVMWIGSKYENSVVLVVGSSLAGMPGAILATSATIIFKNLSRDDSHYKSMQSTLTQTTGVAFLLGGFLSPLLNSWIQFEGILILDAITFVSMAVGIIFLELPISNGSASTKTEATVKPGELVMPRMPYLFAIFVGYAATAVVPLFASIPSYFAMSNGIAPEYRPYMWMVEAGAVIVSGFVYRFHSAKSFQNFTRLAGINGLILIAVFMAPNLLIIMTLIFVARVGMELCFMSYRDYLICRSRSEAEIISVSTITMVMKFASMTVSPFVLTAFGTETMLAQLLPISILFSLQAISTFIIWRDRDPQRAEIEKPAPA